MGETQSNSLQVLQVNIVAPESLNAVASVKMYVMLHAEADDHFAVVAWSVTIRGAAGTNHLRAAAAIQSISVMSFLAIFCFEEEGFKWLVKQGAHLYDVIAFFHHENFVVFRVDIAIL